MAKAKKKASRSKKASVTQNDLIIAAILALVLGLGGGYALGVATESDNNDSTASSEMSHNHGHSMFMVSAEEAPTVSLEVEEDAKSGYNVRIFTTNFTFTPEDVNGENVVGEGHAHVYVDGEKVGRVYGEYFHVDQNFEGSKEFRVTLNANDHADYAVDGVVIEDTVVVTHDSDAPGHDESHMKEEGHSHGDGSHSHSM